MGQVGQTAVWSNLGLSPDGKNLSVDERTGKQHIFIADLERGVFSRLNPGDTEDYAGEAISPDGRVVLLSRDIYLMPMNGAGAAEPLLKSATQKHPNHWSRGWQVPDL